MGFYEVGTLIKDQGKVGIIKRVLGPTPKLNNKLVNLRHNYEIYYFDGVVGYLGCKSFVRLVEAGYIEVLHKP